MINQLKKYAHVVLVFHPEMGYDVNMILQHNNGKYEQYLITSADVSIWNETPESIKEKDLKFEKDNGVKIIRLPYFKPKKKNLTPLFWGLKKTIKAIKPDISFVHGIESYAYAFGILSVFKYSKLFLCDTHTLYNQFSSMTMPIKLYINRFLKPRIINKINTNPQKVLAFYTAKENKSIMTKFLGINKSLVFDNEISTNFNTFFHQIDVGLKQTLSILDNELVLMYIGKFDAFKQPHIILDAIQIAAKKIDKPIHLILGGPKIPSYFDAYFNKESIDGLAIKTTILPPIDNKLLYKYYSLAYCLIIPKFNSLSSLDAQACKTPVIMENDETNADRLKKGGLLYESGNMEDLAQKIVSLCNNPQLRNDLAENGYQYVQQHFDYCVKVDRMNEMIEEKL